MNNQSPFSMVAFAFGAMIVNMVLVFATIGIGFFPSNLAVVFGLLYGSVCAAIHVLITRKASLRSSALSIDQRHWVGGALRSKNGLGLALLQLICGYAGFSHGLATFYTLSFGASGNTTHTVTRVTQRNRPETCFKHQFAELSWPVNWFYGLCSKSEYPPGSRFTYRGRHSPLGFQYELGPIEIDDVPLRSQPSG
jgi:hypothetical protein